MGDDSDSERTSKPRLPARACDIADSGRNATGLAIVWKQLEHAEQLTASLKPRSQATAELMTSWGLTRRRARATLAAVAHRLRTESQLESREQRLERYRAALESQAHKADVEGDRKAAIAALAVLVKLEGDAAASTLPAGESSSGTVVLTEAEAEAEMARRMDEEEVG
jgi:hypothetical protein